MPLKWKVEVRRARMERNVLISLGHPEFGRIRAGLHQPVWCDERLFERQPYMSPR